MKIKFLYHTGLFLLMAFALTVSLDSCKKSDDDPQDPQSPDNEPEQITTVRLLFLNDNDALEHEFEWSDPDGPGGDAPTVEDIALDSGRVYRVEVQLLDESGDDTEDTTVEVKEEGNEHLLCYEIEGVDLLGNLNITKTDSDGAYPIGLETEWEVLEPASGDITVLLKHQPDGEKDGSCGPGDTDVEVTFNVMIQ